MIETGNKIEEINRSAKEMNSTIRSGVCKPVCWLIVGCILLCWALFVVDAGIDNSQGDVSTALSTISELAKKQQTLTTLTGIIVTTKPGRSETRDRIYCRLNANQYRLDELPDKTEDALRTGRIIPTRKYYDGSNFWEEVGNLVVRSSPAACPIDDQMFINLNKPQEFKLSIQTNGTGEGICVLEREVQDTRMTVLQDRGLTNPDVLKFLASNGVDVSATVARASQRIQQAPKAHERLWFDVANGICFKREVSGKDGRVLQSQTLSNLEVGVSVAADVFRPSLENKQVVKSTWPYDQETQSRIARERSHIQVQPPVFNVVTNNVDDSTVLADAIVDRLNKAWEKRDLATVRIDLQAQTLGTPDLLPALLAEAAYVSLLENKSEKSQEILNKTDGKLRGRQQKSYEQFKEELKSKGKLLMPLTGKEREAKAFEIFREGFPLGALIKKVVTESQIVP